MTSCGPDIQNYNYTHMYSFVDYRRDVNKICITPGTMYEYLVKSGNFTKFNKIIRRANIIEKLNEPQNNCTLFAPSDNYLTNIREEFFDTIDVGMARQIFDASVIDRKITKNLITSSPVSYYYTRNDKMRMYVINIDDITKINNSVKIIKYDINVNNGLIHIIDGLIIPNEEHFMN